MHPKSDSCRYCFYQSQIKCQTKIRYCTCHTSEESLINTTDHVHNFMTTIAAHWHCLHWGVTLFNIHLHERFIAYVQHCRTVLKAFSLAPRQYLLERNSVQIKKSVQILVARLLMILCILHLKGGKHLTILHRGDISVTRQRRRAEDNDGRR